SARVWRSRVSASWRSPSAATTSSPASTGYRPPPSSSTRSSFRSGPATQTTSGRRSGPTRGSPPPRRGSPGGKRTPRAPKAPSALPPAGRGVLNPVFLYPCTKAGLDYAIVNTERLQRYPSIPEEERQLAEDLIYWRGHDPVAAFAAYFREKRTAAPAAQTLS